MATCTHLRFSAAILFSGLLGCSSGSTNNTPTCQVAGQTVCNTPAGLQCFDTSSNSQYCGASCSPCLAGQTCSAGVCTTVGMSCGAPNLMCGATCANPLTDSLNCGVCGNACTGGKTCQGGSCQCAVGSMDCTGTGVCSPLASDPMHCGNCATACTATAPLCNAGVCSSSCSPGLSQCGSSCVSVLTDVTNCGTCGNACPANNSCTNGVCVPPVVIGVGGATSVGVGGATSVIGQGGATSVIGQGGATSVIGQGGATSVIGQGGATTAKGGATSAGGATGTGTRTCPVGAAMISDFEDGPGVPKVLPPTGINGAWEAFHNAASDGAVGTQTMAVESIGTTACSQYALHTSGSGWGSATAGWVGIGLTNLAGTATAPAAYSATAKNYTGIRFKAKLGAGHAANAAVRFNISTPETEGSGSGGKCTDTVAAASGGVTVKAARPCYQHVGKFLQGDYQLTTDWKTVSLCFDRDLYPLSLPHNLTNAQRDAIGANMLKIQFQFNQGKNYNVTTYPAEAKFADIPNTAAFDFWLDDLEFTTGACTDATYTSASGTAKPFPQNKALGTCATATNAAKYNGAIAQAYARWTANFVRADGSNLKVIAPEQSNGITTSEAMGYGMLIAAAMGDKTSFDKMWGYVQSQPDSGMMKWSPSSTGTATDGDEDIIYGLLMAAAQWGGTYSASATSWITAFKSKDVVNNMITAGSGNWTSLFNASYFAPSFYRKFGGLDTTIANGYAALTKSIGYPTGSFPTDWADPSSGAPGQAGDVQSGLTNAYAFDAARVPWRVGLDVCGGGTGGTAPLTSIVNFFAGQYDQGATIDLMKAGWLKSTGLPAATAKDMQGSFIGPLGVGAMATGNAVLRDRAFRAVLDILENGDFNHTYFPSTLGLITLLTMSGNFPTP